MQRNHVEEEMSNVWKPISIGLAGGLVASIGIQAASANGRPSALTGTCFEQPNIAHAKQAIEETITFLGKAEHNKSGWRDRALAAANKAKDEITGGCAAGYTK
jgi:hypothetical protein